MDGWRVLMAALGRGVYRADDDVLRVYGVREVGHPLFPGGRGGAYAPAGFH